MIQRYTPAKEIMPTLIAYVDASIDACTGSSQDTEGEAKLFVLGQLQAFNMMYNLLTTIMALPKPEDETDV
jgi:hypothetical protein